MLYIVSPRKQEYAIRHTSKEILFDPKFTDTSIYNRKTIFQRYVGKRIACISVWGIGKVEAEVKRKIVRTKPDFVMAMKRFTRRAFQQRNCCHLSFLACRDFVYIVPSQSIEGEIKHDSPHLCPLAASWWTRNDHVFAESIVQQFWYSLSRRKSRSGSRSRNAAIAEKSSQNHSSLITSLHPRQETIRRMIHAIIQIRWFPLLFSHRSLSTYRNKLIS
jgi:hypothetical protein